MATLQAVIIVDFHAAVVRLLYPSLPRGLLSRISNAFGHYPSNTDLLERICSKTIDAVDNVCCIVNAELRSVGIFKGTLLR